MLLMRHPNSKMYAESGRANIRVMEVRKREFAGRLLPETENCACNT
jgi:hypothetical protein